MIENNWKNLWSSRSVDKSILLVGDSQKIFMELKRSNGFDVVKDQLSYESFLEQYRDMKKRLFRYVPRGGGVLIAYMRLDAAAGQTCSYSRMTG